MSNSERLGQQRTNLIFCRTWSSFSLSCFQARKRCTRSELLHMHKAIEISWYYIFTSFTYTCLLCIYSTCSIFLNVYHSPTCGLYELRSLNFEKTNGFARKRLALITETRTCRNGSQHRNISTNRSTMTQLEIVP